MQQHHARSGERRGNSPALRELFFNCWPGTRRDLELDRSFRDTADVLVREESVEDRDCCRCCPCCRCFVCGCCSCGTDAPFPESGRSESVIQFLRPAPMPDASFDPTTWLSFVGSLMRFSAWVTAEMPCFCWLNLLDEMLRFGRLLWLVAAHFWKYANRRAAAAVTRLLGFQRRSCVMRKIPSELAVGTTVSSGIAENWGNLKFMEVANVNPSAQSVCFPRWLMRHAIRHEHERALPFQEFRVQNRVERSDRFHSYPGRVVAGCKVRQQYIPQPRDR